LKNNLKKNHHNNKPMGVYKNLQRTTNQAYLKAATDPKTGYWVADVYLLHYSKLNRPIWSQVWNYYRHRNRLPLEEFLKQNKGNTIRITWAGQPPEGLPPQTVLRVDETTYPQFYDIQSGEEAEPKVNILVLEDLEASEEISVVE